MSEPTDNVDIGVLEHLPEPVQFLAVPAVQFGGRKPEDISEPERCELDEIARVVRQGNFHRLIEEFLEEYPMTEFPECFHLLEFFQLLDQLNLTYKNYLLSFVTDESGKMVSIHLDLNGAEYFLETLEYIRDALAKNDCPHEHFFADDELTATRLSNQKNEVRNVGHVKIYGWNDEWAKKHNLRRF